MIQEARLESYKTALKRQDKGGEKIKLGKGVVVAIISGRIIGA